jgi:hypothetical protein
VTVDANDNIYVAGVPPTGSNEPEATPGASQGIAGPFFLWLPLFGFPYGGDQFVASHRKVRLRMVAL